MPKGEVSTKGIVRHALSKGKQVFVPYLYQAQHEEERNPQLAMDMVSLHSSSDYDGLEPDAWGIPTPTQDSIKGRRSILDAHTDSGSDSRWKVLDSDTPSAQTLDMIVVPGVAFDGSLGRLGHGKGFYDYFLQRYYCTKQASMPFLGR